MAEINEFAQQHIDKIKELCKRIKPLVVIHCITYNHEPYIRDALDGFVMQKTDFPFVAIVHEDASTDKTAEVVKEYAEKYPDIILPIYEKDNQYSKGTLGSIMNEACKATEAKYIAMCEGDDYWTDPLKLQKQFDILQSHENIALTFHNAKVKKMDNGEEYLFNTDLDQGIIPYWKLILLPWCTPTASFFFRSSCFPKMKQPKDMNGDMFILFGCGINGDIYYSDDICSVYRSGTIGSLSYRAFKTTYIPVYKKKLALMRFINRISNNRYFLLTSIKSIWCYIKIVKCKILGK